MAGPRRARRGGQRFDVVSVSESRRVRQSVCWCVCAVLRGPRGREAWVWAAAAARPGRALPRSRGSRCAFKNTRRLLALAAPSPRLRSRREAASRSRAFWTLSGHGATMAAIVYELFKRLAFQLSLLPLKLFETS